MAKAELDASGGANIGDAVTGAALRQAMARPLSEALTAQLRCPHSASGLRCDGGDLVNDAGARYPVANGVPVLIDETQSIFRIDDLRAPATVTVDYDYRRGWSPRGLWRRLMTPVEHFATRYTERDAIAAVRAAAPNARVLVIGCGDDVFDADGGGRGDGRGEGGDDIEFVYTDVVHGPLTQIICDAHSIPFADDSFDAVFAIAVLEHVVEPQRVVDQIWRVLRPGGHVFAATSFMQQVHLGAYDFMRFTELGHRRLFRRFEEVAAGARNGVGNALGWSLRYFVEALPGPRLLRRVLGAMAQVMSKFLTWLDPWIGERPGVRDAAGAVFFFGRKSDQTLSDHDLLKRYRR